MANPYIKKWDIEGTSIDKKTGQRKKYKVSQRQDGNFACSCMAWIMQKGSPRNDCQHILKIKLYSTVGQYKPISTEVKVEETRMISFEDV